MAAWEALLPDSARLLSHNLVTDNLGRATTHQQRQQDRGWHHVTDKFCAVEDEMPVARHGLDGLICDVGHSESEARRVLGCGCYFVN